MPTFGSRYIGVDWGTTNRRVYLIENGCVTTSERDDRGVTAVAKDAFAAEIASLRARFGDLPLLLAGMVGSNIGWQVAPYISTPADITALGSGLHRIDDRTAIIPGVSQTFPHPDVMRGEEVQLLGAVTTGLTPPDAVLVQPGTHCKWVTMQGGAIARFTTAMTGELFALLRKDSVLADLLTRDAALGDAFLTGVEVGRRRDLAASLFGIRASALLDERQDAASYASGLLIGADVAARVDESATDRFYILDDSALGLLYAAAIEASGMAASIISSRDAFSAGLIAIGDRYA